MSHELDGPFQSIEGAQEYMRLLYAAVLETRHDVEANVHVQIGLKPQRRSEALRLVLYKLESLEKNLKTANRTLNDLRTLRRLLLEDRVAIARTPAAAVSEAEIQEYDGAC
jgi:hypothetical protein